MGVSNMQHERRRFLGKRGIFYFEGWRYIDEKAV